MQCHPQLGYAQYRSCVNTSTPFVGFAVFNLVKSFTFFRKRLRPPRVHVKLLVSAGLTQAVHEFHISFSTSKHKNSTSHLQRQFQILAKDHELYPTQLLIELFVLRSWAL